MPTSCTTGRIPSNAKKRRAPAALDALDNRRHALAHPDAHGREPVPTARCLELADGRQDEPRSRHAQRVTERDRARRSGLTRGSSSESPSSRRHASDCAANASFSSMTSMRRKREARLAPAPAASAGTGPIPMMRGSTPAAARWPRSARSASGRISFSARSDAMSRAAAPSLIPDELPAVTDPPGAKRRLELRQLRRSSCRGE